MTKIVADYFKGVDIGKCSSAVQTNYTTLIPLQQAFIQEEQTFCKLARKSQDHMRLFKGLRATMQKREDLDGLAAMLDSHHEFVEGAKTCLILNKALAEGNALKAYHQGIQAVCHTLSELIEQGKATPEDQKFLLCFEIFTDRAYAS